MEDRRLTHQLPTTDDYYAVVSGGDPSLRRYLDDYLTYAGDGRPAWQNVENGVTSLVKKVLQGSPIPSSWNVHAANGIPIAIVHQDFAANDADFLLTLLEARELSMPIYTRVARIFDDHELSEYDQFASLFLPIVCIDVNSQLLDLDFEIEGFSTQLHEALAANVHWKASSHLIFSDSENTTHDFPSYARDQAETYGIGLLEFQVIQTSHENNHLLLDAIVGKQFDQYGTWFHEGGCELLTGFSSRAVETLREFKKGGIQMTAMDVLRNNDYYYIYGGGWLLLREIASIYSPEDDCQGIIAFIKDLLSYRQDNDGVTISEATLAVLEEKGIKGVVFRNFDDEFNAI